MAKYEDKLRLKLKLESKLKDRQLRASGIFH